MARSLDANALAGKDGDSQPTYCLMLDPIIGTTLYLSSPVDHSSGGHTFDGGRIAKNGVGNVRYSIKLEKGGNLGVVSGFEFRLVNADYYSDTFLLTEWMNAEVTLKVLFPDQASPNWNFAPKLYVGFIKAIEVNEEIIKIKCVDSWNYRHREILSDDLITRDTYLTCPDVNIGKVVPAIYGDFTGSAVHKNCLPAKCTAWTTVVTGFADHALTYRVGIDPSSPSYNFLLSRHTMYKTPTDAISNVIFRKFRIYQDGIFIMLGASSGQGAQNWGTWSVVGGHTVSTALGTGSFDIWLIPTILYDYTGTSDGANAVDEDETNYTTLTTGQDVTYAFGLEAFDAWDQCNYVYIGAAFKVIAGSNVDDIITIRLLDENDVEINHYNKSVASFTEATEYDSFIANIEEYIKPGLKIKIEYSGDDGLTIGIKNLYAWFCIDESAYGYYNPEKLEFDDSHYVPCQGREYSYSRGSHSAGDLIEHPVGVIESILVDELGLDNAAPEQEINTTSFDAVETALGSSWKFAGQLLREIDSLDLLKKLAFESTAGYTVDSQGFEMLFSLIPSGSPTVLTTADFLLDSNNKSTIEIETLTSGDLYSSFVLNYREIIGTSIFDGYLYCNKDGSNLSSGGSTYEGYCEDVHDDWGIKSVWEYDADFIRDDATAELFLKFMIEFLTVKGSGYRYKVNGSSGLNTLALEIGDQVKINHPLLPAAVNNTNHFVVSSQKIIPKEDRIDYEFFDVGAP